MNAIVVIFTIIFISAIGYVVIRGFDLLSAKENLIAIGASFGLGVGLISAQLYVYSKLNIAWQKESLLFPWIFFIMGFLLKNRKSIRIILPKVIKLEFIDKILIVGILLTVSYVIFEALLRPVTTWDAWANWLLQAKVFFVEGRILPDTLEYMDSEYPLTINLLGTFIYIILAQVDDTSVLLTSSAFYVFLAILFFAVLKERFSMHYALLFTMLLVATQNFVRHGGRMEAGLADLPLGYCSFICVVLLFKYMRTKSRKPLLLLNVFLSITALIKFEGLPISIFITLCTLSNIYTNKLYRHLPIMLLWLLPFLAWKVDRRISHLTETYFFISHRFEIAMSKSINAFTGTIKELINIKSWGILWIVYFYSLLMYGIKENKELAILNFIILCQLVLYLVIYNTTAGNNPESSIQRLLMHIAPMVFYYLALLTQTKLKI